MKIGIDARFYGPQSKGLGRYTQKLVEHLEDIDQENDYVIFMTARNIDSYTPRNPRFKKVLADYKWYTIAEQILFPWTLHKSRCDFVHFPHFNVPLLYLGRFLVTIHDLILVRYPTHKASTHSRALYWFKYLMYRMVIASAIYRSKEIFAVSTFTKNDILEHYKIPQDKIHITLEAGNDISVDKKEKKSLGDQSVHSIMKPYFLYVGNAYPHKNVPLLVDAFALFQKQQEGKSQSYHLVLVGREDYFYKEIRSSIKKKGIKNILIFDTVSNHTLDQLYRHAHAFLFPSLYEGFGLPPLEACGYGVPVLSSEAACMPEILGDAVQYCDATSREIFAKGIQEITSGAALRKKLSLAGPHQAKKYSWTDTVQRTHKIYKNQKRIKVKLHE